MSSLDFFTYQQKAVYITTGDYQDSQNISGSIAQLSRIQNVAWNINFPIQNQSYIDAGTETITPTRPTVSCSLDWLTTNGYNEEWAGLSTRGNVGAIAQLNIPKNLYISTENTIGGDAVGSSGSKTVIGVGQVLLNSYSIQGQVGSPLKATVTFEGLNAGIYTGWQNQPIPAVSPIDGALISGVTFTLPIPDQQYNPDSLAKPNNIVAALPSNMMLEFPAGSPFATLFGPQGQQCAIQSFRADFNINRANLHQLGSVFPANRPVTYPVEVDLGMDVLISKYQSDQLNAWGCATTTGHDVNILVLSNCLDVIPFEIDFRGMQFKGQSSNQSIGNMESVSFNWNLTINDPFSTVGNVFLSSYSELDYLVAHYLDGSEHPFITSDGYNLRVKNPLAFYSVTGLLVTDTPDLIISDLGETMMTDSQMTPWN